MDHGDQYAGWHEHSLRLAFDYPGLCVKRFQRTKAAIRTGQQRQRDEVLWYNGIN